MPDSPDWPAVLAGLDEPGELGRSAGLEFPRDFDQAATAARFRALTSRLSEIYGVPVAGHAGPRQDAALFGDIVIPAEATGTRDARLVVQVSNFGDLAAYGAVRSSPVHADDRERIETALTGLGYRVVPREVLAEPYRGPNEWVLGSGRATWHTRFFDYL